MKLIDGDGQLVSLENHWRNTAAFYVAGGPSYRRVEYQRLRDRGVLSLGVNNVAGDVPCSAFCCSDPPRKFHHGIWRDGKVLKFAPDAKRSGNSRGRLREKIDGRFRILDQYAKDCPATYFFQRDLDFDPPRFFTSEGAFWGVNDKASTTIHRPKILFTFFIGLRLLHYLGVRRIYLLGVDFWMDPKSDQNYGFGQRRDSDAIWSNNDKYRLATEMLRELKPHIEAAGVEVYNCNRDSALKLFGYVPFDEALDDCRNGVPLEPFDLADWYQTESWLEGRYAALDGKPLESCGIQSGKAREEWIQGWHSVK